MAEYFGQKQILTTVQTRVCVCVREGVTTLCAAYHSYKRWSLESTGFQALAVLFENDVEILVHVHP